MNSEIKRLIETGTIICGRVTQEDGIVKFERIETSQIEEVPEEQLGFATASMGRAIFTIGEGGEIHNFKGVDSHLSTSELGPMDLVGARAIEYVQGTDGYKVSAVIFNGQKPEIRINGTSPLEDIEIEGDINRRLAEIGIKVPRIEYIREIPQEFSRKYGLPIKVEGSLDEFESDYALEDDERRKRLGKIYGSSYVQELPENQRPESMREYLQRIGFLSSSDVQANIELLGYSMQDFVEAVDNFYSRGQRYGQAERIMGSPFRISDLETCILNGNMEQLQAIMDFSQTQGGDFTQQLAEIMGKNTAILMNNGWECENLVHRQDFSLTGEFCDDSYFDMFEKEAEMQERYSGEPYKVEALKNEMERRYTGQVMHMASCIKVVQEAMALTGRSQTEIDAVLETFVESFTSNLDFEKMGQLFKLKKIEMEEKFMEEFSVERDWVKKMSDQDRREGTIPDKSILGAHSGNGQYYSKVARMIAERMRERQALEGKDGFEDCMADDKTRLSSMQEVTITTKNNMLGDATVEHNNDEQGLE